MAGKASDTAIFPYDNASRGVLLEQMYYHLKNVVSTPLALECDLLFLATSV